MKKVFCLAVIGAGFLTACGSKTDANEKNFGAALTHYFDKKGELCLGIRKWPVDLSGMDLQMQKTMKTGTANQMAVLESVGLVKGEDATVEGKSWSGQPSGMQFKVKRYTLTDVAKKYVREKDVENIGMDGRSMTKQSDLCWGKKALAKVVKWEGPMKLGDYQEARVTYTYKLNDLADWAKNPEIQTVFPVVGRIVQGENTLEEKHGVKLTSEGWEALGLDR